MASRPDPAGGADRRAVRGRRRGAGVALRRRRQLVHAAGGERPGVVPFRRRRRLAAARRLLRGRARKGSRSRQSRPGSRPARAASEAARPGLGVGGGGRPVLDPGTPGASHRRRQGRDRGQHAPLRRRAAARHILQVMEYLQDYSVEPALWTVEGLGRHDDAVAVAAMAQRAGRQARCLVGGRHAPYEKLEHWLQVAAPIPDWAGFAIGRSIWWDPLRGHLRHLSTAGEARRRIRAAYLDYARYYLKAREGRCPRSLIRRCDQHATALSARGCDPAGDGAAADPARSAAGRPAPFAAIRRGRSAAAAGRRPRRRRSR